MLFLPLLDKTLSLPELPINKSKLIVWWTIAAMGLLLIALNPDYAIVAVGTLLFSALLEECFFRAYFMQQLSTSIGVKCNESPRWGYLCRFAFRRICTVKPYLQPNCIPMRIICNIINQASTQWVGNYISGYLFYIFIFANCVIIILFLPQFTF